jgi:hypothetical protein
VLVSRLQEKYGLEVAVDAPVRDSGNVDTWRVKLQTRPQRRDLPAQRIHIDICAVPSYQVQPMMLRNHYGIDMGASGVIVNAQSRDEILADKLVAFALRPNRIKHRDLWDIVWLHQQGAQLPVELVPLKLRDHHCEPAHYLRLLHERLRALLEDPQLRQGFIQEMRRFLPVQQQAATLDNPQYWQVLCQLLQDHVQRIERSVGAG